MRNMADDGDDDLPVAATTVSSALTKLNVNVKNAYSDYKFLAQNRTVF